MTEYELPSYLLGKIGKENLGTKKMFILKFTGTEDEINIKTIRPEFIEWKWVNADSLPKIIVDFKKKMYEDLLLKIKPFIH